MKDKTPFLKSTTTCFSNSNTAWASAKRTQINQPNLNYAIQR